MTASVAAFEAAEEAVTVATEMGFAVVGSAGCGFCFEKEFPRVTRVGIGRGGSVASDWTRIEVFSFMAAGGGGGMRPPEVVVFAIAGLAWFALVEGAGSVRYARTVGARRAGAPEPAAVEGMVAFTLAGLAWFALVEGAGTVWGPVPVGAGVLSAARASRKTANSAVMVSSFSCRRRFAALASCRSR